MDLGYHINILIIWVIWFVIILLTCVAFWLGILAAYAPSFRLRKLKKLIRQDNQEYNEILADKARLQIEKANTQLQYDKLVVQKSNTYDEIKQAEKQLTTVNQQLTANQDAMNMLNEFLNTPAGKQWLATYAALQAAKEKETDTAASDESKAKPKKGK